MVPKIAKRRAYEQWPHSPTQDRLAPDEAASLDSECERLLESIGGLPAYLRGPPSCSHSMITTKAEPRTCGVLTKDATVLETQPVIGWPFRQWLRL